MIWENIQPKTNMKKERLFFWENAPIIMLQIENEYGKVESSFWSDKENLCCYSFQDRGWREELNVGLKKAYQSGLA